MNPGPSSPIIAGRNAHARLVAQRLIQGHHHPVEVPAAMVQPTGTVDGKREHQIHMFIV